MKISKILATLAIFTASAFAFSEGSDYLRLEKPLNVESGTLVKVFSYACPHCYQFDKSVMPKLLKILGDEVKFVPIHLSSKGDYGETASKIFAVLELKDEAAGISLTDENSAFKKAKTAIYKAAHDKGETWRTKDGGRDKEAFIKTALDAAGVKKAEFEAMLGAPKTEALLAFWQDSAYDVAKIQGVPAFVVNGKYLINTNSVGSIEALAELIKELLKK